MSSSESKSPKPDIPPLDLEAEYFNKLNEVKGLLAEDQVDLALQLTVFLHDEYGDRGEIIDILEVISCGNDVRIYLPSDPEYAAIQPLPEKNGWNFLETKSRKKLTSNRLTPKHKRLSMIKR